MEMKDILNRMLNHEELSREETRDIIVGITKSEFPEEQITALLTGLQMRGVTVDELLGFRDGILATDVPAILDCDRYIDVVGTGGDRKNTFNISTTSCFVIAGAGYKVAKHGNYAATSTSGGTAVAGGALRGDGTFAFAQRGSGRLALPGLGKSAGERGFAMGRSGQGKAEDERLCDSGNGSHGDSSGCGTTSTGGMPHRPGNGP